MLLQPLAAITYASASAARYPLAGNRSERGLFELIGTGATRNGIERSEKVTSMNGLPVQGGGEYQSPRPRARRLQHQPTRPASRFGCGPTTQAASHQNPASTIGNSRQPVKPVQSGIFAQITYFSRLFYFPFAHFQCLHPYRRTSFHIGKLRPAGQPHQAK